MSYSFDGANDTMAGSMTSVYGYPITLACWLKVTTHPVAADILLSIGNVVNTVNGSFRLTTAATDDGWTASIADDSAATAGATVASINVDGVWAPFVGTFTSNVLRDAYIVAIGNTATNATSRTVTPGSQSFVRVGETPAGGSDYTGKLAELAVWNKVLSTEEITAYLAGSVASGIAAANLVGYWPLSSDNSTQTNLGLDATGDLTVTTATFDADHPTILSGGSSYAATKRRLMMGVG